MTSAKQERPLTRKGALALARLIKNAPADSRSPDARPLAKYVLTPQRKRKRK